jgi:GNAT superfamily N-acetyltransferase
VPPGVDRIASRRKGISGTTSGVHLGVVLSLIACSIWVAARRANKKVVEVARPEHEHAVRPATTSDAVVVAELLDAFNREFDTPSPGTEVLVARLQRLIAGDHFVALVSGEPAVGVAVLSFRPSVWYEGPVATLDELYVQPDLRGQRFGHAMLEAACRLAGQRGAQTLEINVDGEDTDARRFYEAHGFANTEPEATEPTFYYYRQLT